MKHTVPQDVDQEPRLREYLLGIFPVLPTNAAIKKAIKQGAISVNGQPARTGYLVRPADVIVHEYTARRAVQGLPPIYIPILYQDDFLAIVNKPPGLTSSGKKKVVLANYLPEILQLSAAEDALAKPLLVHRLDKATSGLILAAKTAQASVALSNMLADHQMKKTYHAIVEGKLSKAVKLIDTPIDGQTAETIVEEVTHLYTSDPTSLIKVGLRTGRTHQIRIHMASIGHPIVGDPVHNATGLTFRKGLFLQATAIAFSHPITADQIAISIPLASKFRKYL